MEFDRRVQIRVDRLKDGKRTRGFGSGYLVAPRLVLTAAHVLDHLDPAAGERVTVSLPDTGEKEFSACVRWQGMSGTVDAALIEITAGQDGWQVPQSLRDLLTRPPQRYGLVIGNRPLPVTATGFPRMQKDSDDGRRLDEQLTGHIAPGTGALADRYEISSAEPTAGAGASGGSRWSGMSGAGVLTDDGFGGDLLCGVVRRDRLADGGTRLTATPAAALLADDGFRVLVAQHTGWEPVLEPIEPAPLFTPATVDRNVRSPAALLRADTEAVAFHGRESELAALQTWCESGPPSLSVRVMTGPGGQGKTRLARRLTDTLGRYGWVTGHLRSDLTDAPAPDSTPPDFTALNTALPLLLVIDYAETRPRLLRRLITHLHRSRHRVRLLLLARSDGEWRTGSLQAIPAVRDLLEDAPLFPLTPLLPTSRPAQEREDAFHRAVGDLARLLPLVPSLPVHDWLSLTAETRPPADLHDHRYNNVLTLQMTALVTLLQHGPLPVDANPGTPPERTLLKHEDRFWEASASTPAHRLDLDASTLSATVAIAALCGADTREEAIQVITILPGLPGHRTACATDWLASLYPADGNRYWGSLQPDRIAEYHASQALETGAIPLPALLEAASPTQQAQTLTVLARAAIAHYNTGRTTHSDRVLRTLDTALDIVPLAYEAVQSAAVALPYLSRVTASLALRLTAALTEADLHRADLAPAAHEPYLARSLSNLGVRLSEAGQRAEALAATEEAVEIQRRLAAENPDGYEPALARSLSNLGSHLAETGRRAEGLDAEREAVQIRRRLAAEDPAAHEPDLATSLSNLGVRLSDAGHRVEALAATEEAMEAWRRLVVGNPFAHLPYFATSLSNLGVRLSDVGRGDEALAVGEEAVEVRRRLAAENPADHEPDLATSLSNLGNYLSDVGRGAEALTVAEEAVEVRRRLAAENPAAYERDLAGSLSNLGNRLLDAGRSAEARAVGEEVVEIRRRLAAENPEYPAVYLPDLAGSLSNLGRYLSDAGRSAEAEQQAAEIRRGLAAENPAVYEHHLAVSLSNLGVYLSDVGRGAEALDVAEQAVEIRRRLAAENPARYEPDLARSLTNLGNRLSDVGRSAEALAVAEEAVEIRRRLTADDPARYEPDLATSLAVSALSAEMEGDLAGALRMAAEAAELYRRRIATTPALLPRLRAVWELQASVLDELGRPEEAEAARLRLREGPHPPE
ncbi:tetratricopeptide repeat protein [Streptomyces sp. NBC_00347]|uniref:tetratricopeptide repeat protein n=1 Tax=Streptomyces sp. NBC_00347 TaxID=2975721 RepID=UPI00224F763D|nr:tetratricopeptide repeat protein [Streptomyces sp. NBC_00347]MCX5128517.1 tetratricopeptide repeat protein [Streptomyces sp. NBC_00347]